MSATVPAKSILKQPSQPPQDEQDQQKAVAAKNKRHLDIALQHAYLIQHQKDTQDQILKHLEILIDWPASPTSTPKEASDFLRLITIFQPSDFDDLVEERRIDAKCGYPLCLNEPQGRKLKDSESWKLKKGAADFCSNFCMKKALFVKAQLSPTPAWERIPGQHPTLHLHEDDWDLLPLKQHGQSEAEAQMLKQRAAEKSELALERGEQATSLRPNQVMLDQIIEKIPGARQLPERGSKVQFATSATAIEGYEPGGPVAKKPAQKVTQRPAVAVSSTAPASKAETQQSDTGNMDADSSEDEEVDEDHEQQWRDMLAHVRQQG